MYIRTCMRRHTVGPLKGQKQPHSDLKPNPDAPCGKVMWVREMPGCLNHNTEWQLPATLSAPPPHIELQCPKDEQLCSIKSTPKNKQESNTFVGLPPPTFDLVYDLCKTPMAAHGHQRRVESVQRKEQISVKVDIREMTLPGGNPEGGLLV